MVAVLHKEDRAMVCDEKTLEDEFCDSVVGCGTDFICIYDDLCTD